MILVKTEGGQRLFKDRSVPLTPRQRSAYILCDGKRSVDEVLQAGMGLTREDIEQMVELGLLGPAGAVAPASTAAQIAPGAGVSAASNGAAAAAVATAAAVNPAATVNPVAAVAAAAPAAPAAAVAPAGAGKTPQQRYQDAYPIATQLTGSLGLRGFRLNLSVEGTSGYEQLLALYPKIEAAVGAEKAAALKKALSGG